MMFSNLPAAVAAFFEATETRDATALYGALANDAVLIDMGKELRGPAIRTWNETFYLGANVRAHPIHVELRDDEIAVTVALDGDYAKYGVTEPSQFEWGIRLRDGKIASMNMVEQKLEGLPGVVATFVKCVNMHYLDRALATFAADANVNDRQRDHWGRAEIRDWLANEIIGDHVTLFVIEQRIHEGRCFVVAKVTGTYDKTGLPDPLTLRFYFSLAMDRITQLVILPVKAA